MEPAGQPDLRAVRTADDITWTNDGSLAVKSMMHRRQGTWAIDTSNPNAWAGMTEFVGLTSADITLGQETKLLNYETDEGEAALRIMELEAAARKLIAHLQWEAALRKNARTA